MGETRNACRVFVGHCEKRNPFGRLKHRWTDNTCNLAMTVYHNWYSVLCGLRSEAEEKVEHQTASIIDL
jgi:hypothetical protein